MGNLLTADVTIEGTRPLLWHAFTLDAIPKKKGEQTGVAGNDPEEWKRSVLATPEGQLYVGPFYIFACLRDGARYTKQGRASLQSNVIATLQVLDERVFTNRFLPNGLIDLSTDPSQTVYLDVRGVKNPATKGRNIRYRVATAQGWQMTFHILWDATLVNREQMQSVVIDAGQFCGLSSGRQIGFGRFRVIQFEVRPWQEGL